MRLPPGSLALVASLAALFLYSSCGGGDETTTPEATATSTAPPAPTGSPPDEGVASTSIDAPLIDLATASPMTVVYAIGEGDLRSDQPGLAIGDFNDDSIDDMLVGARFADTDGREDAGAAYVIFGSADPPSSLDLAEGQAAVTVLGPDPGSGLGFSVAAADVNGDGVDDIALGAPFAGDPQRKTGAVYIFFGPLLPAALDLANDEAGVTIHGAGTSSFFGDSLAAGDLDGDGTADLIIGATFDSGPGGRTVRGGATYAFLGRERWPAALSAGEADISIYGAEEFDELGDFVASGDINGDGFDDIIATAEAADGPNDNRPTAAEVHVVFGGEELQATIEIARSQQDLSVYGAYAQDTLGFSLATGDLNGDGTDDLVMGARLGGGPGNAFPRAGQIYVLFGRADLPASVDLLDMPNFVSAIHGRNPSEFLGTSEAVADLDGDGRNELIMGASGGDAPSRLDAGTVYIASEPLGTEPAEFVSVVETSLWVAVYGGEASDRLGSSVAAGDFNGDGKLEVIAIAMDADGPEGQRPGAGRIYVISVAD